MRRGVSFSSSSSFLPLKMRTDLALQIHYRTLSKVKLFQDCDSGLLKELVVKLSPTIYLPGTAWYQPAPNLECRHILMQIHLE